MPGNGMVKPRNRDKIRRARAAMLAGNPDCMQADGSPLVDLDYMTDVLANLCHLARLEGVDMREAFRIALDHYEAEK